MNFRNSSFQCCADCIKHNRSFPGTPSEVFELYHCLVTTLSLSLYFWKVYQLYYHVSDSTLILFLISFVGSYSESSPSCLSLGADFLSWLNRSDLPEMPRYCLSILIIIRVFLCLHYSALADLAKWIRKGWKPFPSVIWPERDIVRAKNPLLSGLNSVIDWPMVSNLLHAISASWREMFATMRLSRTSQKCVPHKKKMGKKWFTVHAENNTHIISFTCYFGMKYPHPPQEIHYCIKMSRLD
jgi:hypothetical protein